MTNDHEEWRQAPGYVGGLEVSNRGRVRNRKGPLRGNINASGYRVIDVRREGEKRSRGALVHRLVLEAFVGPCPPGMQTRHLDGDPGNNHLGNLRWGTPAENNRDTLRHGRHEKVNRKHCPRGHALTENNLNPSQLARGRRSCQACHRARSFYYYRDLSPALDSAEFKALADTYMPAEVHGASSV